MLFDLVISGGRICDGSGGNPVVSDIGIAGKEIAADNESDPDAAVDRMAAVLTYALVRKYGEPANFFGVGGMKIFRDLIWQMQGLMREDHRFYKAHGFYDFPQKQRGRMAAMYLVGAMMKNQKLSRRLGGKMTEGMLLPYKKILERAEEK